MSINLQNADRPSTINVESDMSRGTHYLTSLPTHYEIQRSNNFMFYIDFPEGYFDGDSTLAAQSEYARANASEVLRISVNSAFVPHFTTNPIELKRGNNTMKFAGVPSYGSGEIQLDDFIGAGTKDMLLAWQRKVYNSKTEKVGLASDYKRDASLVEYTPDYQVVRTWKIIGCWISGLTEDPFNHESAEKHNIRATIEYDRAEIDIQGL